jgi:hypothetical protein
VVEWIGASIVAKTHDPQKYWHNKDARTAKRTGTNAQTGSFLRFLCLFAAISSAL